MSYAVEENNTGAPEGTGTVLPPIIGKIDIWDGIWAAAPQYGLDTLTLLNYGSNASVGSIELNNKTGLSMVPIPRIKIIYGRTAKIPNFMSSVVDYTSMWVIDIRSGSNRLFTLPGCVIDTSNPSNLRLWHGSWTDSNTPITGKHVIAVVRREGYFEVWIDGVMKINVQTSVTTDKEYGIAAPSTNTLDVDFYESRFCYNALSPELIQSSSIDFMTFYGF